MIGKVVGSYKITEKIGEGGMGAVFRGMDVMLEREVAIKVLRPELASQPEVVERFRAEAVTLAKLNHPNIATLYSFLREGEDYFMVMEFVRGQTIDHVIRTSGSLAWTRAIALFSQALEGIDHAHRLGIIHRDLKPANIMLAEAGSIKVMDFGIARALGTARMTKHGSVVGTLEYISPEQIRGQETDARSDIYSLGILLYEMLTGRVPFTSDNEYDLMRSQIENAPPPPRTFAPHIPLPVEQAIMRALAKKREARYQTAGEFRAVLLGTMGGAITNPISSTPATYAAPATRALDAAAITSARGDNATGAVPDKNTAREARFSEYPSAPGSIGYVDRKTRVDQSSGTHPTYQQEVVESAATEAQPAGRQPSLLNRLNRKHYIAAAIVLLIIAGATIALIRSGVMSSRQPAPEAEQPAPQPAPSAEQNAAPVANPADEQLAPTSEQSSENAAVVENENANRARPATARANRNEVAAETPAATDATPTPQPETTTPPPVVTTPPEQVTTPPTQPNTASVNANANVKKEQKKGGGIGGVLKKIFGGGGKKNANTNKAEKKP